MGHGGTLSRQAAEDRLAHHFSPEGQAEAADSVNRELCRRSGVEFVGPMKATETHVYPLDGATGAHAVETFHPPQGPHFDPSYEFKAGITQQKPGGSVDAAGHFIRPGDRRSL